MSYNFSDSDQREAAMAAKWAECCEENTVLRQQLSAAMAACEMKDRALSKLQRDTGLVVLMRPDQVETIANALLVQPDDSALKVWLGEPITKCIHYDEVGMPHTVYLTKPLYSPKGMK